MQTLLHEREAMSFSLVMRRHFDEATADAKSGTRVAVSSM